jgi:hypothetical protein
MFAWAEAHFIVMREFLRCLQGIDSSPGRAIWYEEQVQDTQT